jgi:hypothetical protein
MWILLWFERQQVTFIGNLIHNSTPKSLPFFQTTPLYIFLGGDLGLIEREDPLTTT